MRGIDAWTLKTMINWNVELPKIRAASTLKHVDACFIAAIRQTEDGGQGIEFGVEPPGAYDYEGQLRMTVTTVAHRLATYPGNPLSRDTFGRVVYSDRWIDYFASIWAPIGAKNDPDGLNKNWSGNCKALYAQHIANEKAVLSTASVSMPAGV